MVRQGRPRIRVKPPAPHAEGYRGAAIGSDPRPRRRSTRGAVAASLEVSRVKLTPNVTDITEIRAAAERGEADAIVAINTVKAMRIPRLRCA